MKRNSIIRLGALAGIAMLCQAAQADYFVKIDGVGYGASAGWEYVVGLKSSTGDDSMTSFLYNVTDGIQEWQTQFSSTDDTKCGRYIAINSLGMIAGTAKNPDMRIISSGGGDFAPGLRKAADQGEAICSAAVWRGGKKYLLGAAGHTMDEGIFIAGDDGTHGIGISPDGNTVYGQLWGAWMPIEGCYWTYNQATDTYIYSAMANPEDAISSYPTKVSADGRIVIGSASVRTSDGGMPKPCIWTTPQTPIIIDVPNWTNYTSSAADAISDNGRYVAITASGKTPYIGVYDIETGTLTPLSVPDRTFEIKVNAIDNNGNLTCQVTNQDSFEKSLFYYNADNAIYTLFSHYLSNVMEKSPNLSDSNTEIVAMSGDGKHYLAKSGSYSIETYLIDIDNPTINVAAAPTNVKAFHNSPQSVTVTWKGIESIPDGLSLTGYTAYVDGTAHTVETTDLGGNLRITADAASGRTHNCYVVTNYTKDGTAMQSGKSQGATAYVSTDTELISLEDFNDCQVDANGNFLWSKDTWQAEMPYGSVSEVITWHAASEDFENRTPYAVTYSIATTPWSSQFISHFMDATDAKDFRLNIRYKMHLVNNKNQNLSTDYMDIEASEDGENWTVLKSICAADLTPAIWQNVDIDLGKEWAGRVFQIRINAHGEGKGTLSWSVDDINITDKTDTTPVTGLIATENSDKKVSIAWKNSINAYELSYLCNSGYVWDECVGNEGKPLTVAISLTPEMLKPYIGKQITSLTTFIFDDPNLKTNKPTKADAIIYADNKEVARAQFLDEFTEVAHTTAWFDTPVMIEKDKEYRAAVRIYDYDRNQTPVYYQKDSSAVSGASDLFSEDEGKTWQSAASAVKGDNNPQGYCIWPIRANIDQSDAEMELTLDESLLYYEVFRDGVAVNGNIYAPHPFYTDPAPAQKATTYQVRAYYSDGRISQLSEPLTVDVAGINKVAANTLRVTSTNGIIIIEGEYTAAYLTAMNGMRVAASNGGNITTSNLPTGVYILNCLTPTGNEIYRILVK